jgi:hypothetical protein
MPKEVQFRRGTTQEHSVFTGANGTFDKCLSKYYLKYIINNKKVLIKWQQL